MENFIQKRFQIIMGVAYFCLFFFSIFQVRTDRYCNPHVYLQIVFGFYFQIPPYHLTLHLFYNYDLSS